MKKSCARLSFLACLLIIGALFILSQPTMSLSNNTSINVVFEFEKTLQLTISDPELYIEDLQPGTTDNTNEIYVNVATNSETGFIMDAAIGDRLRPSTRIPNVVDNITYFQSVGLNNTVTTIPAGSWGYSIDHGATYSGLPDYRDIHPSDVFIESYTVANMSLPFLIGATAAEDQARGIYYAPITFRAVSRPVVANIENILYMQEFDETVYASMKAEKQYQLMDKRDGKMYFLTKLKTGNVWMTQNLDFDLYDGIVLDPETSDVKESTTMEITPLGRNREMSEHYYYYDNYFFDQGDYYCPNGYCYNTNDLVPLSSAESTDKENHYALGNRYSFSAATAAYFPQCIKSDLNYTEYNDCQRRLNELSGVDSETSVCPAGWTLPSASSSRGPSPYELGVTMGFPSNYSTYSNSAPIFMAPLYLVGNGYVYVYESSYSNYTNNGNNYAYYWLSTNSGSYDSNYLYAYLNTRSTYDQTTGTYHYYPYNGYLSSYNNTYSKYNLLTVRCVARAPQYKVEYYMNDGISTTPYNTWTSAKAWSGNDTVKPRSPARAGYNFVGWGTSPRTVEARYYPDTTIKLDSYNTKLYAVWEELDENDPQEGVYTFEAVLRRAGKTAVNGTYSMQDLTSELCQQVAVGSTTMLRDARDGKLYEVSKDKLSQDGEFSTCWMHDDLRLGSKTDAITVTPEDTDTPETVTIPAVDVYTYTSYDEYISSFMMDNTDVLDEHGTALGYLYNYNLATLGYHSAHRTESGWRTSDRSICPKNWTLPRYYEQDSFNSEKQVWDNIDPVAYTQTYYENNDYGGKRENIMNNFIKARSFASRSYGNNRVTNTTHRFTKDFNDNNYYKSSYSSANTVSMGGDTHNATAAMVRCMIPTEFDITTVTITYNYNFSSPSSTTSTQRVYINNDGSDIYHIKVDPQGIKSRPGWQLLGWSQRSNALAPDYYDGDIMEIAPTDNIQLYAVWKRNTVSNGVTFDEAFEAAGKTKHGDYYAMQDMTPEICDAVADSQQGRLIDVRDNKVYWVGRITSAYDTIHEGECWMTQNLDFEISLTDKGTQLDPETSDVIDPIVVRADVRDADAAYLGYSSATEYYLEDGGLKGIQNDNSVNAQFENLSPVSELEKDDKRWHYHMGSYYSWAVAAAINDIPSITDVYRYRDRDESICPQGWKLPSYNYNQTGPRSFNALYWYILQSVNVGYTNYYGEDPMYPTFTGTLPPTTTGFDTMIRQHSVQNFMQNAFHWTANTGGDRYAYYWTVYFSGRNTNYDANDLKYGYYTSYSYSSDYVYYLRSVRCVAR